MPRSFPPPDGIKEMLIPPRPGGKMMKCPPFPCRILLLKVSTSQDSMFWPAGFTPEAGAVRRK